MKKKLLPLFVFLLSAHGVLADNWMSRLPDNLFVSQVSIPGTHDAATGNGVQLAMFSQCQDVSVDKQWEAGIRAFDFRPIVKDDHLHINHGIAETELRFDDALFMLRDSLKANPSEFVVLHLLYANNFANDKATYATMLSELLERDDLKEYLIDFRRDLTVGEMRGKMLLLSRDQYATKPFTGGIMYNWCGYIDWNAQTSCSIKGGGAGLDNSAKLYVQDYSNTNDDNGGVQAKVAAVKKMLDFSTKHTTASKNDIVWVFNFASSYPGDISTADGYRGNATHTHAAILDYLQTKEPGPTGIVLMDYACVDKSPNETDGKYAIRGKELVDSLIANNFKWLAIRNQAIYNKQMTYMNLLKNNLNSASETIATECADVATEFDDDLKAIESLLDSIQCEMDSLSASWLLTDEYKVDYVPILRQITQLKTKAAQAQSEYAAASIPVAEMQSSPQIVEIYSLVGERLVAPRIGTMHIVKLSNGEVRKMFF